MFPKWNMYVNYILVYFKSVHFRDTKVYTYVI
nr:MAG TPA: hypothetical protein [Caudoviricetes sp.]